MDIDTQFLKGSIGLLLLNLLSRGEMYGYEILQEASRRSANAFEFKEGTLYPALLRLEQMGWIAAKWGVSDNNRRARFYSITRAGKKQLAAETQNWERISCVVARFAKPTGESA